MAGLLIDWKQGTGPSRTGTFSGETATVINIGAAGSPVSGPQFGGACVIGGVFYTHNDFPAEYRNTYFFGDYVNGWIRSIAMDGSNKPVKVTNSVASGSLMAAMATHPVENGIYYVNYGSEIRKINYNVANRPPVAVASADKKYGPGPLSVQFRGSASSDPEGQPLTWLWNFGDGATSTAANPSHTFTTTTGAPVKFTVKLTVKDTYGSKDSTTLIISVNNTPPQVIITSPADGTLYSPTSETTYDLKAAVTDKESSDGKLSYQWQTILHHETHEHPDPVDTSRITTTTISASGCGTEIYYYRVLLTVTDAGGLSARKEVRLYPNCSQRVGSLILVNADNGQDIKTITPGETINLANLPTKNLNIRAKTIPSTVGSVKFKLSGAQSRNPNGKLCSLCIVR
jgi:PKD repeat protein